MASKQPPTYAGGAPQAGGEGAPTPVHQPAYPSQPQQGGAALPAPAGYGASVHAPPENNAAAGGGGMIVGGGAGNQVVALHDINHVCCCSVPSSAFPGAAVASVLLGLALAACAIVTAARGRDSVYCPEIDDRWPDTAAGRAACTAACAEKDEECFEFTGTFLFALYLTVFSVAVGVVTVVVAWSRMRESEGAVFLPPTQQGQQHAAAQRVRQVYMVFGVLLGVIVVVAFGLAFVVSRLRDSHSNTYNPAAWGFSLAVTYAIELLFLTHIAKVRMRLLAGLYGPPAMVAGLFGPHPRAVGAE